MKIAQVAPLCESVPPKYYGGTERVVSYLTEALLQLGHEVTLYASGDSVTNARLRPGCKCSLRLDKSSIDPVADHVYLAERVFRESSDFDIIHSHIDYIGFPLWRRMSTAHLTTLHGRLDIRNLFNLFKEFKEQPVASISDDQRHPLPWANWLGTVYHGLPAELYRPVERLGSYLAFLGRISPEKRVDRAIEIARRAGLPLRIAAKIDARDQEYYQTRIKPLLHQAGIEYIGEIGEADKNEFLGNALGLLFPIEWPEPFGLVMVEALACGTPVVAFARGSVPEILETGLTGFVVDDLDEAVRAVGQLPALSRRTCRRRFEEKFTATRMAADYLALYQRLLAGRARPQLSTSPVEQS